MKHIFLTICFVLFLFSLSTGNASAQVCGDLDQSCCQSPEDPCKHDLLRCNLSTNICESCGRQTEACCESATPCDGNLECTNSSCQPSEGPLGNYTCAVNGGTDPPTCVLSTQLSPDVNPCSNGGFPGDNCRLTQVNGDCTLASYECETEEVCGKLQQRCCGYICPDNFTTCNQRSFTCEPCGHSGEQCCVPGTGDVCATGLTCYSQKCTTIPLGPNSTELRGSCQEDDEIDTAIGCVPLGDMIKLTTFIFGWAVGIAGGLAFILILVSGFQILTSGGDPKKLQAGKELLGAAIGGVIVLIFAGFILRIFGVNILGAFQS